MVRKGCTCLLLVPLLIFIFIVGIYFINIKSDKIDYKREYINNTIDLAQTTASRFGLFPSVVLAQSALESNYGTSELSKEYNNYFGIKSKDSEDSVNLETKEVINGKVTLTTEPFRKYLSKNDSFNHYGKLISQSKRYEKVKTAEDFKQAAKFIQEAGYATDPNYADKIIAIVEKYKLGQFDRTLP